MAEQGWPSATIKNRKLEGHFGHRSGGDMPLNERELETFFVRYPNGNVYSFKPACVEPRRDATSKGPIEKGKNGQIMQDAINLMRDPGFQSQELARLNKDPSYRAFTAQDIGDFSKKMESVCFGMRKSMTRHAMMSP